MRKVITGEQVAQLYNRDPFALPVWRAPIYQTPAGFILLVQLARLLAWLARLIARHPLAAAIVALLAFMWVNVGWLGLVFLAAWAVVVLAAWRLFWPGSFARWVSSPARGRWRAWFYRRRWAGVMAISGVAPGHQGRIILPVLGKVTATKYTDRVAVRLVSGQSPADVARHADALAHGFGALLCRVRSAKSGGWCWSSSAVTPWPPLSPPCPSPTGRISRRCRSAAGRTGWPGWSGCTAPTC